MHLPPTATITTGLAINLPDTAVSNFSVSAEWGGTQVGRITPNRSGRRKYAEGQLPCALDTGQGISREFLPHVFECFRQANASSTRQQSGLELGLAIVRHLVELHGGTVRADSPGEGSGTTITVELPLLGVTYREPAASPACPQDTGEGPSDGDMPSLQGLALLVVDGNQDTRDVFDRAATGAWRRGADLRERSGGARRPGTRLERNSDFRPWDA